MCHWLPVCVPTGALSILRDDSVVSHFVGLERQRRACCYYYPGHLTAMPFPGGVTLAEGASNDDPLFLCPCRASARGRQVRSQLLTQPPKATASLLQHSTNARRTVRPRSSSSMTSTLAVWHQFRNVDEKWLLLHTSNPQELLSFFTLSHTITTTRVVTILSSTV